MHLHASHNSLKKIYTDKLGKLLRGEKILRPPPRGFSIAGASALVVHAYVLSHPVHLPIGL